MKALSLLLTVLLAATTLAFVPVSNYNLNQIQGTWYIQSIYDTTHNDWSLAYCYEITFDVLNDSAVNMTMTGFDGFRNHLNDDSSIIIPNSENPAILCQDSKCEYPLMVLNTSTLPYWIDGEVNTTIFAFDYGKGVIVLGGSRAYDTRYDMRPYLASLGLTINSTIDFWFVNSACDTHFGWNPLKKFNQTSLLQNFSLIAVYDPAGTGLVPWYTGNGIFDWTQAYCAGVSFQPGKGFDFKMTLSLNSLYQGEFMRSWQVMPTPDLNAAIMGFGNTLLYVQYSDAFGNLVLTTGTSTSFLLSTSAKSYSLAEKTIFELTLKTMGTTVDLDYVYPIDNTSC